MRGFKLTFLFFLIGYVLLSFISTSSAQSMITVGFHTSSLQIEPGETFTLNLTIFTGGASVKAGEFNITYDAASIDLQNIQKVNEWEVMTLGNPLKYVFYTLGRPPNNTVIAMLNFKHKVNENNFNVTISIFKAADASGNDLSIALNPAIATITVITAGGEHGGAGGSAGVGAYYGRWLIVASIAASAIILLAALYVKTYQVPLYYMTDNAGRVVVRPSSSDRIYGREDFTSIVSQAKLSYITRLASGGQFRISKVKNEYYIMDAHSKNPTLVNNKEIKGKNYVKLQEGSKISLPDVFELIFRSKNST